MHDQPSIRPGELLLKPPEGTLPVDGGELPMSKMEADKRLKNPVAPTEESIGRGKALFDIYCAVCHGGDAKGNGPVAKKFIPPPDITAGFFKQRSDGFIYSTIKYGGAVMPPYGEDMTIRERWDLVNYLRRLQGK
jgi:mono/diheme cytochrome c family protein